MGLYACANAKVLIHSQSKILFTVVVLVYAGGVLNNTMLNLITEKKVTNTYAMHIIRVMKNIN